MCVCDCFSIVFDEVLSHVHIAGNVEYEKPTREKKCRLNCILCSDVLNQILLFFSSFRMFIEKIIYCNGWRKVNTHVPYTNCHNHTCEHERVYFERTIRVVLLSVAFIKKKRRNCAIVFRYRKKRDCSASGSRLSASSQTQKYEKEKNKSTNHCVYVV